MAIVIFLACVILFVPALALIQAALTSIYAFFMIIFRR